MSLKLYRTMRFAGYELLAADPVAELFLGRIYFNTAFESLRVYNGTIWVPAVSTGASSLTQFHVEVGDGSNLPTETDTYSLGDILASPFDGFNIKAGASGFGLVPLGGVTAVMGHLAGTSIPVSGVVENGWMRADGAVIPGGHSLSGNTPNITGSAFVMGTNGTATGSSPVNNPSSGASAGGNTQTFSSNLATWDSVVLACSVSNPTMPAHYHNVSSLGSTINVSSSGGHDHFQQDYGTGSSGPVIGSRNDVYPRSTGISNTNTPTTNVSHTHATSFITGTVGLVTGGQNGDTGTATTGNAASFNKILLNSNQIQHSHSSSDMRPKYVAAIYLIRVS